MSNYIASFYIWKNVFCISYIITCIIKPSLATIKAKFSMKDFFSECDHIRSLQQFWLHLLNKSLMENFIICAVRVYTYLIVYIVVYILIYTINI